MPLNAEFALTNQITAIVVNGITPHILSAPPVMLANATSPSDFDIGNSVNLVSDYIYQLTQAAPY